MRFFQTALLGFNNLWIRFIIRAFNCVSMSKIPLSKWRVELDFWEVIYFTVPEEIVYSFLVYIGIVQIGPMYHSLDYDFDLRAWFTITPF